MIVRIGTGIGNTKVSFSRAMTARIKAGIGHAHALSLPGASISAHSSSTTRIKFGFVCQDGVGETMLCWCDGALVTVDGKYLIVKS